MWSPFYFDVQFVGTWFQLTHCFFLHVSVEVKGVSSEETVHVVCSCCLVLDSVRSCSSW